MEYEPKTIPEGINTSKEHPLREFFILALGLTTVIVVIVALLAYSADYLIQYIPVEKENEWFSSQAFEKLQIDDTTEEESNTKDDTVTEIEHYLQDLITQLQREGNQPYRFNVRLFNSDTPNAFVVPGGHIFVTRGLLESVNSENGLAMVLAHEMGHQYHRHPLRAAGRGIITSLALLIIGGSEGGGLAQSFIGHTALLTNLNFNREQEREADTAGVDLIKHHYGHSQGASEFFEAIRDNPALESDIPVFMSTHPGVEERIEYLREQASGPVRTLKPLPDFINHYLEDTANLPESIRPSIN